MLGSMNQGKLEEVKQEMARVNIDILGIRELKWTGMGEFNSHDHYIYWMEVHDIVQETGIKTIPKKKKCREVLRRQRNKTRSLSPPQIHQKINSTLKIPQNISER